MNAQQLDVPAVNMPNAAISGDCGIVLCDKIVYFGAAFYCWQPKAHLCKNRTEEKISVESIR